MLNLVASIGVWAGFISVLLVGLAGPIYRFGVLPLEAALGGMALAGLVGLVVAVLALIIIIARFMGASVGLGTPALSLFFGGAAAFFVLSFLMEARSVPPIHDITTDTANPPAFVAVASLRGEGDHPVAYDGAEVAALQSAHYTEIRPLNVSRSTADTFAAALEQVEELGWTLVDANEGEGRIEAFESTMWWGFTDDVVIRVRSDGAGSIVDLRSKSRVGQSDLGVNAARIDAFLAGLERRLAE